MAEPPAEPAAGSQAEPPGTLDGLANAFEGAFRTVEAHLPTLVAALALLLLGWIAARLLRRLTLRLGHGVNALLLRQGRRTDPDRAARLGPPVLNLAGNIVFWLVILLFIALAARVAQLDLFTDWLDRVSAFVPTLVVGALIVLAGFLAGMLARDVVAAAMRSAGSQQGDRFGLVAQGAIFLAALVIGLDQVGIDVLFLTLLFALAAGGVFLSLALAFGLGAGAFVGNLLGANQAQRSIQPGETVRVGEHEGQVLEFTTSAVVLATEGGRLVIPGKVFQEETVLVVAAEVGDGDEP